MEEITRVFGINWSLLLIQAINFGLVVFVLTRFLYKPVMKLLDERKEKIAKGVEDANAARALKEKAESQARVLVMGAEREAEITASLSKKHAEEKMREAIEKAEAESKRALLEASKEADRMKAQALVDSKEEIARLGVLAAEKILRGN